MKKMIDKTMRNEWICFAIAVLITWIVMLFMILGLSFLLYMTGISEGLLGIMILLVYLFGNLVGGYIAGRGVFSKHYLAGIIVGTINFGLFIILSLCVNHGIRDFGGVFFTTLIFFVGSGALGGMIAGIKTKKL